MATKTGNIVEDKLNALWELQTVDSAIDKIRQVRGELPLEVEDLEDEVAGMETRIGKVNDEMTQLDDAVVARKNAIKESKAAIKKYTEQQNKVRNNREFESLNKEIEYQTLEIELSEKKIKEFGFQVETKKEGLIEVEEKHKERQAHLKGKKKELEDIVKETEKDEKADPPPKPEFRPRATLVDLALADAEADGRFFAKNHDFVHVMRVSNRIS